MKNTIKQLFVPSAAIVTGLFLVSCDVDKTEEGAMPDVDVDVDAEAGKLPKYDVEGPEVTTGTKKVEMEVPTIDVSIPEDNNGALENNE